MNRRLLVSLAALGVSLAAAAPARAHRLDEYLQATRLSIERDRVSLEIDLTPGVSVAPRVLAWIDTNRDGQVSDAEGEAYAREMLGAVTLSVDNRPATITIVESRFPNVRDMSLGEGTIRLRATATLSTTAVGRHQVSYLNAHRPEASVYLVNALVPANPRVRIDAQRRDSAQHGLTLEYRVRPDVRWTLAWLFIAGVAMTGVSRRARPARSPWRHRSR